MLGIDRRLAVVWFPAFALLTALTYADIPRVFGVPASLIGAAVMIVFFAWGGVVSVADGEPLVALGFFLMTGLFVLGRSSVAVPGETVTFYVLTGVAVTLIMFGDHFDELAITGPTGSP